MTDNPNSPGKDGETPIYWAARNGYTEIVKILASLTDNPNTPRKDGETPIYWAACNGYTEIVKILSHFTKEGDSQINVAKNAKMCKTLESFKTSTKRNAGPRPSQSQKRAKKF